MFDLGDQFEPRMVAGLIVAVAGVFTGACGCSTSQQRSSATNSSSQESRQIQESACLLEKAIDTARDVRGCHGLIVTWLVLSAMRS